MAPARVAWSNPVIKRRADPSIFRDTDGYYYFTASVPSYDRLVLRRSKTLDGLRTAPESVVWKSPSAGPGSGWVWAPDIHKAGKRWYLYYSASDKADLFESHRMYVMHTDATDPTRGKWVSDGQIRTGWESFSLDETVFSAGGVDYLVWAQQGIDRATNSNLYIARMSSPTAITGQQVLISQPDKDWERVTYKVNEAPAVLQRNGRVFISYSAAATDKNYSMGLLTAQAGADLLDPASWSKSPTPVFTSNADDKIFGPGSNTWTVSEDGKQTILVYHARAYDPPRPDPLNDPNRDTRMQVLGWHADGTPDFGPPLP